MSSSSRLLLFPTNVIARLLLAKGASSQVAQQHAPAIKGQKMLLPGSGDFTLEFNEPPSKTFPKPQPMVPKIDKPSIKDAIAHARTPIIGLAEINELVAAREAIEQLMITPPAAVELLPVAEADPDADNPAVALPPAEVAAEWLDQRTLRLYEQHRFVERLGAFAPLIQIQTQELAALQAALSLPEAPGIGYLERSMTIRQSIGRMVAPHRYLAFSFGYGVPAPIGHFACRALMKDKIKALLPGKPILPAPHKASTVQVIEYANQSENHWCGQELSGFATTTPEFALDRYINLPLVLVLYSRSLAELELAAAAALARFASSVTAHDRAVVGEQVRATTALSAEDAHLGLARAKLDEHERTLAESERALTAAMADLAIAKTASAELEVRVQTIQAWHVLAVKDADAAVQIAEASEAAATSLNEPVIAQCNGTWQPYCSVNVAEQRKVNEAQKAYFTELRELTHKSTTDRITAMTKMQNIIATSIEQINVQTELFNQRSIEVTLQKLLYDAHFKRDQDDITLQEYRKLFDAAAARSEAVGIRLKTLAERRELILKSGPDDLGVQLKIDL